MINKNREDKHKQANIDYWRRIAEDQQNVRAVITPTTSANISIEYLDYPAQRNRRIAIKRAVYIELVLIITWGLVWIAL